MTDHGHDNDKGEGKGSVRLSFGTHTSQKSTTTDTMIIGGPNSSLLIKPGHDDVHTFDQDMFDKSDTTGNNHPISYYLPFNSPFFSLMSPTLLYISQS